MKFSIRSKLLIGFIILLTLSFFLQVFIFNITKDYIGFQTRSVLLEKAISASIQIENLISELEDHNEGLASEYKINPSEKNKDMSLLGNYIIHSDRFIKKVSILSLSGKELIKIDENGQVPTDDLSFEVPTDQFSQARSGKISYSKIYYIDGNQGPHLDIFTPIFLNKESVIGVVKMQANLFNLWNFISRIKLGSGFAYVVDDDGRLIVHPNEKLLSERPDLSSRPLIRALLDQKDLNILTSQDFVYRNENNTEVIAQAVKIPQLNWFVIFEQPTTEAFSFIIFIRNLFTFTVLGSLALLLLIAFFLSNNLTRPILQLQLFTKKIEKGDLGARIKLDSHDEIEALGNSINNMANELNFREENLRASSEQMAKLMESLTDGVIATDEKNRIILFNKAAEFITGFDRETVKLKSVDTVLQLCEDDTCIPLVSYSRQDETLIKKLRDKGLSMKTANGKKIYISLRVSPIIVDNQLLRQNGWIVTFHDITKEQELEEMKLDFVSMAAHELRTPLTAIRGYAQLLKEDLQAGILEESKNFVDRLVVSSENLSNLIDNLLNVSRIERNAFKVETKPIDIFKIAQEVVTTLENQARTKKQSLLFKPTDRSFPLVMADKFRLNQVLSNLVANAINYTPEGGTVTVALEKRNNFIECTVTDTGIGIPQDALPKLFSKFFRVSGKLEEGSKGTGLGLFIAKSIINMHKGEIWVDSVRGKGSTFHFTIPLASDDEINKQKADMQSSTLTGISHHGIIINNERYEQLFGKKDTNS